MDEIVGAAPIKNLPQIPEIKYEEKKSLTFDEVQNIESNIFEFYTPPTKMDINELDIHMFFFKRQAEVLGMSDLFIEIHSAITPTQHDQFKYDELAAYCNLMDINIEPLKDKTLLCIFLRNIKLKWIEMKKYHTYIEKVLFSTWDEKPKYPQYVLEHYRIPSTEETLTNGFSYYYYCLGELTPDGLIDRYDRYELLNILAHILVLVDDYDYNLKEMSARDLAGDIIYLGQKTLLDIRTIVGILKVHKIHNVEKGEYEFTINYDVKEREDLPKALYDQGFDIYENMSYMQMYGEYLIQSFSPSFVSILDPQRIFAFSKGDLFYGVRTGFGQYEAYTFDDLIKSFKFNDDFIKPGKLDETFSLYSINRLIRLILPKMTNPKAKELLDVINKIKIKRNNIKYYDPDGNATASLFNLAFTFEDWETTTHISPIEEMHKYRGTIALGAELNGDVEYEIFQHIIITLNKIKKIHGMGNNRIIRLYDDKLHKMDHSIISYIEAIKLINSYKYYKTMRIFGMNLLTTAAYYDREIRCGSFNTQTLKIEL